ncbi:energy transducer TonB [Elstera sp.]|jgi:protein TonB|uniref:energy transducer TonB n=1 Tax=Elstera sp. TaxID=1916664 RepID=UPI0037BF441D
MAKAFLTSFSLHVAAVGLLVWLAPDGQSMPSEKPQLIELQPMALLPSPPPAPAVVAEPEIVPEPPQIEPPQVVPPPEPPPPEPIAELPPPPEPPLPELPPLPEPPPEVKPEELIRSVAAPVDPLPPPPPPKPKPAPKPRPIVAKSPPAVPKAPQEVTPVAQSAPEPVAAPPSVVPPQATEAASVASAAAVAPSLDSDYTSKLSAWLLRHRPDGARTMRGQRQGQGMVRFTLNRAGKLLSKTLLQSTGNDALDRAILEMVDRASPMPAFPPSYPGDEFTFDFPIQFQLR